MKTQVSKILALGAALTMATLAINPAFADDAKNIEIRFAGGFIQNIQQDGFPPGMGMPAENRSVALVKGRGTFGRVDIMAVTAGGPPASNKACPVGLDKIADIVENNLVLTFGDLSLLYGNGTGIVCANPADQTAYPLAEIEGTWEGGTGRFSSAGGDWSIQFDFAEAVGRGVGPDTQFIAETGVIKGHVTGLRDHDRDDD